MTTIIGVDVDLTVVDSGTGWIKWGLERSKLYRDYEDFIKSNQGKEIEYDLRKSFPDVSSEEMMDYWRQEDLYDSLMPFQDSVAALAELKGPNTKIVFVSTIKGNHHKSKYNFIKKHFPFMDGFLATKEKQFVRLDAMIDDRLDVLGRFEPGVVKIQFDTPYTQSQDNVKIALKSNDWNQITKFFKENYVW